MHAPDETPDDIRDSFGEKVAMYFAFIYHYTRWLYYLTPIAMVALCVQLFPIDMICDGKETLPNGRTVTDCQVSLSRAREQLRT